MAHVYSDTQAHQIMDIWTDGGGEAFDCDEDSIHTFSSMVLWNHPDTDDCYHIHTHQTSRDGWYHDCTIDRIDWDTAMQMVQDAEDRYWEAECASA